MEKREVEQILAEALPKMRAALALDDWEIVHKVCALPDSTLGRCGIDFDRLRASMSFDAEQHEDRAELLDTVLHEFCHVLHGAFEPHQEMAREMVEPEMREALDVTARLGDEQTVARIMRLITVGLGLSPEDLLRWDSGAKGVREAVETEEIRAEGSDD